MFAFAKHKGHYVRLDETPYGDIFEKWHSEHLPDVYREAVAAAGWKVSGQVSFASSDHVNIQEMRGLRLILRGCPGHKSRRVVCLSDSRVVIGAYGKGRSSSRRLNGILRSMLGYSILKQVQLRPCWISSAENVSDDPSRFVALRTPAPGSPAVQVLLAPEGDSCRSSPGSSAAQRRVTLEVFSGSGHLTQALGQRGFQTLVPLDAYPGGKAYRPDHDILLDQTFMRVLLQIRSGNIFYLHLGTPCKSWSQFQRLNPKSTRTLAFPAGVKPSPSEREGNLMAIRTATLCLEQQAAGGLWSIENPRGSLLWLFEPIADLLKVGFDVDFDQCEYGLRVGCEAEEGLIRKATRLRTNAFVLKQLHRQCSGKHAHQRCQGKVWTPSGWQNRTTVAGAYPPELCARWAALLFSANSTPGAARRC